VAVEGARGRSRKAPRSCSWVLASVGGIGGGVPRGVPVTVQAREVQGASGQGRGGGLFGVIVPGKGPGRRRGAVSERCGAGLGRRAPPTPAEGEGGEEGWELGRQP